MPHAAIPSPQPDDEPLSRARLRRLADRLGRLVGLLIVPLAAFGITVLVLGLACGGAFLWLAPGAAYLGVAPEGVAGLVPFGALPWPTRLAYAATFVLTQAPLLLVLVDLRRLLRDFAGGATFAASQANRLRRIALWLVAAALAPGLGQALVAVAGHGVDRAWFHLSSVHALVFAALVAVLAALLRVGAAVERDRDGFV
ncbi:DUF2975 domain-containing protein [Methylobacterium variabile]|uniref:DUF2975 domain-containing protein n=1 Tax=Methylobacterium variabile TaxID=298794 RepID=UPI0009F9D5EB|nr:DUF2975 domain-containing protein [Methylobacterium variabile]